MELLYHGKLYFFDGKTWHYLRDYDFHGGAPKSLNGRFRCRHYDFPSVRFYINENDFSAWRSLGGIVDSDSLPKSNKIQYIHKFLLNSIYGKFANAR